MATVNYEEEARLQRQKINYFNSKVGNKDFDKAIDYLIIAEWDEKKAVETYLNLNKKSNIPQKNNLPPLNKNLNKNPKKLAPINNKNQNSQPKQQNPPANYNIKEINVTDEFLKNNPYKIKDSNNYTNFIKYLQNKFFLAEKSFEGFLKTLKEHPGIILLVSVSKMEEFKRHAPKIISNFICPEINKITVLFPIMYDSPIGIKIKRQFSCENLPSYIFCKYESQKLIKVINKMEGVFNLNLFIDNVLKGLPETQSKLKASLKTSLRASIMQNFKRNDKEDDEKDDKDDNKDKNDSNKKQVKDSIFGLSEGQVLDKREREFKELERQQEEKIRKEEEEKQKIIDEENKIKKRMEDYQKEAEISKKLLPDEPSEDNPDVCRIILRYPDGEKTIERRFLKTEKVNVLYIFVKSKGREIFLEQESNDFDLIFGFPPKNLDNSKNNSLEDEGLFPNAIIQIRELD